MGRLTLQSGFGVQGLNMIKRNSLLKVWSFGKETLTVACLVPGNVQSAGLSGRHSQGNSTTQHTPLWTPLESRFHYSLLTANLPDLGGVDFYIYYLWGGRGVHLS